MLNKVCRWLGGWIGYLLFALALLLLFLWLLFPKEALPRLLVQYLNGAYPQLNWQIQSMTLRMPEGLRLGGIEGCEAQDKKKPWVRVDLLELRPDIPGMWQAKRLRVGYRLLLAQGVIAGTLQLDGWKTGVRFDGTVQGVQLTELPMLARLLERKLQGTVAATFKGMLPPTTGKNGGMEATLKIDNGLLALKRPILTHRSLLFSQATVMLRSHGESLQLEQGVVESELFSGQFAGDVTLHREPAASRINVAGTLQPRPDFFKGVSSGAVLQLIRTQLKGNTLPFRLTGALYDPGIGFEEYSMLFQTLEKELQ
ncbi:MAG: type II secretion system protein GspN [Desulfobulbaceae bacterium]|jgi:type II secretion system protein N|nr:type II secretion system protein GspN [Desulfobulbaceae bacterium]